MTPVGKHGDQVFGNPPFDQEHLENLVAEERFQLFHVQRRSDPEHAPPIEASVRYQNMAMGIEPQEIAKGLDGDDRAGDGIPLWDRRLKKDLQGFPGAAAQSRVASPGGSVETYLERPIVGDLRDAA